MGDLSTFNNFALLTVNSPALPAPGTYSIDDVLSGPLGAWYGDLVLGDGTSFSHIGGSVSGTITILSSSADLVEGTLEFEASVIPIPKQDPPVTATVTGSFGAIAGTVILIG